MPELTGGYAEVNGLRLHYQRSGTGRLMLFLHGFPEFWYCWRRQLEEFGRDHLALAPDLRGYNLSDKPAGVDAYKARHLVEDVRQLARAFTGEKFVLVAHDWGGAVAWNLAIAQPELLSHLVIINSPHPYTFWRELSGNPAQQKASDYMLLLRSAKAERVLSENGYARLAQMRFSDSDAGRASRTERAAYLQAWSQPGALTGGLNFYRASPMYPPSGGDPGAARLALEAKDFVVKVPTLVIWGMRDRALLPCLLDGLEACVPDLRIERLPGATHWVMQEAAERVNSLIRDFVGAGK